MKVSRRIIADQVLDILGECRIEGNVLYLPSQHLDRKTYIAVNKVLENIGGKWNRKAKGHVFTDGDPAELLDNVILVGETVDLKKQYQFFPTPRPIADHMCELAEINEHSRVLEPSAGKGAIVDAILAAGAQSVYAVELNTKMAEELWRYNDNLDTIVVAEQGDFLTMGLAEKISVNRVVMNPPFTRQQDIDHIYEAFNVLENGGILVSVVSESPFYRTNKKSLEFMSFLESNSAVLSSLPEGAFRESGTMVRARMVKILKT